ncbi:2-methylaconitate cis-trans isomerase PrpF family protein [Steroidobacter sp.]|uniref:2-methylaconitate cis-trans isomerase PrpF family protein n=1 Tax=Steroidobacter sp. TaxID=1978227 RepID=UPI001A503B18|nr:PrpF domain-containing protein [Steroidobacter sp.]MBL8266425.1 PrpF protein [Steroidobacter sp.]
MHDYELIRAAVIRGGTSKGVFLLAHDLPSDAAVRDQVILAVFGSPDPRQIDGLGGADPITSKLAIVSRSSRPDADVDYTVGYVSLDRAHIDYEGNCGNISQAVGPFAIDEGLVPVVEPVTRVRIFNTNTQKIIEADVPVKDGRARTMGDFKIDGVPHAGSRITLNFVNSSGSKTGKLLPTGNVVDRVKLADGRTVRVSLVDVSTPAIFVKASDIGLTGTEMPADTLRRPEILAVMEELRVQGALLMKLATSADRVSPAVPKVAIVASPQPYVTIPGASLGIDDYDLLARTRALGAMHKAYAVTGGICVSAAAMIEGTVVHEVVAPRAIRSGIVRLGHPSGVSHFQIEMARNAAGEFEVRRSGVAGTARRLMDGFVYVPRSAFEISGS